MNSREAPFPTRSLLLLLPALLLLTLLPYANTLTAPLNYDDELVLRDEVAIKGDQYVQLYPPKYRHLFYMTMVSNYRWGGFDPFVYHLFNILLHSMTSLTVFCVGWLTIRNGTLWGNRAATSVAFTAAAFFALNPVQTEAVTYISGRASSLSGLFFFLALLMFIKGSLKENRSGVWPPFFYLLCMTFFALALFSKETALSLLAIFAVYDICFMRNRGWEPFKIRLGYLYLPISAFGLIALIQTPFLQQMAAALLNKTDPGYTLAQINVVGYALKLVLFPINQTFDYDFPKAFFTWGIPPLVLVMVFIGLLLLSVKNLRRGPTLVVFCLAWFLITIAPTNSLVSRPDLFSERNLYLPCFGLSLMLAGIFYHHLQISRSGRGWVWGAGALVLLLILQSSLLVERNSLYRSNILLWKDALEKSPGKLRALHNLSHFYLGEKKFDEAFVTLKQLAASNASPFYISYAHSNLGSLYIRRGNPIQAEMEFKEGIRQDPAIPTNYMNLGSVYASKGLYREAKTEYEKAVARYRDRSWGYPQPSELTLNLAKINLKLELWGDAEQASKELLQELPDSAEGRLILAQVYAATARVDEAVSEYRKISGDARLQAKAHNNIGILLIGKNKPAEAAKEFAQALAFNPNLADTHFNLGTLLIESGGDPMRARAHLEAAKSLIRDPARKEAVAEKLDGLPLP